MKKCIIQTVRLVTLGMQQNTWREFHYSLDNCRITKGAHTKLYFYFFKLNEMYFLFKYFFILMNCTIIVNP